MKSRWRSGEFPRLTLISLPTLTPGSLKGQLESGQPAYTAVSSPRVYPVTRKPLAASTHTTGTLNNEGSSIATLARAASPRRARSTASAFDWPVSPILRADNRHQRARYAVRHARRVLYRPTLRT